MRLCKALHKRKNWLFAGSDSGGELAALFCTLIRTAKLNRLEPEVYLRHVIAHIGAPPVNRLHDLLPWNIATRRRWASACRDLGQWHRARQCSR